MRSICIIYRSWWYGGFASTRNVLVLTPFERMGLGALGARAGFGADDRKVDRQEPPRSILLDDERCIMVCSHRKLGTEEWTVDRMN